MKSTTSLHRRQLLATAALTALVPLRVRAQGFPNKPMRVIVAGPAGANADIVARLVTEPMVKDLGQTAIVEPKPGAAGAIAVNDLLQSPQDGHTLLVAVNALVSEVPHMVKLKIDMQQSLRPIAELARGGLVLVGNPSFPANNLKDLIAYVKANPGKVNVASYSPGSLSHVLESARNTAKSALPSLSKSAANADADATISKAKTGVYLRILAYMFVVPEKYIRTLIRRFRY